MNHLAIDNSVIIHNRFAGIEQAGKVDAMLTVRQSKIADNDSGIVLNTDPGFGAQWRIEDAQLIENQSASIRVNDNSALMLGRWKGRAPETLPEVWGFATYRCVAILQDVQLDNNTAQALALSDPYAKSWSWGDVRHLQDSNGAPLPPSAWLSADSFMSHFADLPSRLTFDELSSASITSDSSRNYLSVADLFAAGAERDTTETLSRALKFIDSHPDDWRACGLFQSMYGDTLDLTVPTIAESLAISVGNHSNSPLAYAVCGQIAMDAVGWPARTEVIRRFVQLCHAPEQSLAGSSVAAVRGYIDNPGETPELLMKSIQEVGQRWPSASAVAYPGYSHLDKLDESEGISRFTLRCCVLLNLLDQASAWISIGNISEADRAIRDAQRVRRLFFPRDTANLALAREDSDVLSGSRKDGSCSNGWTKSSA